MVAQFCAETTVDDSQQHYIASGMTMHWEQMIDLLVLEVLIKALVVTQLLVKSTYDEHLGNSRIENLLTSCDDDTISDIKCWEFHMEDCYL